VVGGWRSLFWFVGAASFTVFVKGAGFDFSGQDASSMTGRPRLPNHRDNFLLLDRYSCIFGEVTDKCDYAAAPPR